MKVREIIYMILDEVKKLSDDTILTEEHVLFLTKKYRTFLIKKEQDKDKASGGADSSSDTQQICLELEKVNAIDGEPCTGGYYLRTTKPIPSILEGTQPNVYPVDYYQGVHITLIPKERMRYVGTNPYLQNIIYVSEAPNKHLYLKSANPQFLYLRQLRMSAVFDDFEEAADYLCDDDCNLKVCDVLDMDFPMRDYLVPPMLELIVKDVTQTIRIKEDEANNAKDDLPEVNRTA